MNTTVNYRDGPGRCEEGGGGFQNRPGSRGRVSPWLDVGAMPLLGEGGGARGAGGGTLPDVAEF